VQALSTKRIQQRKDQRMIRTTLKPSPRSRKLALATLAATAALAGAGQLLAPTPAAATDYLEPPCADQSFSIDEVSCIVTDDDGGSGPAAGAGSGSNGGPSAPPPGDDGRNEVIEIEMPTQIMVGGAQPRPAPDRDHERERREGNAGSGRGRIYVCPGRKAEQCKARSDDVDCGIEGHDGVLVVYYVSQRRCGIMSREAQECMKLDDMMLALLEDWEEDDRHLLPFSIYDDRESALGCRNKYRHLYPRWSEPDPEDLKAIEAILKKMRMDDAPVKQAATRPTR
jgi:hypothetical protein